MGSLANPDCRLLGGAGGALVFGLLFSFAWASLSVLPADSGLHRALSMGDRLGNDEWNTSLAVSGRNSGNGKVLSRAKRYVVFPKGSSLQLVYCASLHAYVPMTTFFVLGITMGIAWMLPSETRQLYLQRRDTSRHPDREHRLKLFQDVGSFLNSRGLKGQHCVLRTICESTRTKDGKGNFMEEFFRVFFSLPVTESQWEDSEWDLARYNGTSCSVRYPDCASIIDIPMKPTK